MHTCIQHVHTVHTYCTCIHTYLLYVHTALYILYVLYIHALIQYCTYIQYVLYIHKYTLYIHTCAYCICTVHACTMHWMVSDHHRLANMHLGRLWVNDQTSHPGTQRPSQTTGRPSCASTCMLHEAAPSFGPASCDIHSDKSACSQTEWASAPIELGSSRVQLWRHAQQSVAVLYLHRYCTRVT